MWACLLHCLARICSVCTAALLLCGDEVKLGRNALFPWNLISCQLSLNKNHTVYLPSPCRSKLGKEKQLPLPGCLILGKSANSLSFVQLLLGSSIFTHMGQRKHTVLLFLLRVGATKELNLSQFMAVVDIKHSQSVFLLKEKRVCLSTHQSKVSKYWSSMPTLSLHPLYF